METKLNTTDLMRGNWIDINGPVKVLEVRQISVIVEYEIEGKRKVSNVPIENIQPIPLSELWLEKLGFKYDEVFDRYYWYIPLHDLATEKLTFRVSEGFICFDGIKYRTLLKHVTFVHQAQNLMSALKQPLTFKISE